MKRRFFVAQATAGLSSALALPALSIAPASPLTRPAEPVTARPAPPTDRAYWLATLLRVA